MTMATNFSVKVDPLTFIHHPGIPKQEWNIIMLITKVYMPIIWLHCVKIWWTSV